MSQITTHILDTATGKPASGVRVVLCQKQAAQWEELGSGVTNADGRIADLLPEDSLLEPGTYRLVFEIGSYFRGQNMPVFYPEAQVSFNLSDHSHYHIPLLISPFSYSTYRGS